MTGGPRHSQYYAMAFVMQARGGPVVGFWMFGDVPAIGGGVAVTTRGQPLRQHTTHAACFPQRGGAGTQHHGPEFAGGDERMASDCVVGIRDSNGGPRQHGKGTSRQSAAGRRVHTSEKAKEEVVAE